MLTSIFKRNPNEIPIFEAEFKSFSLVYIGSCWLIMFIMIILRIIQIKLNWKSQSLNTLTTSHILMIISYFIYITINLLNSILMYNNDSLIPCNIWYLIVIISFGFGRIFQYLFFIWRSYIIFKGTMITFNKWVAILFIISNNVIMVILSILLFINANIYNIIDTGYCVRIINSKIIIIASMSYDIFITSIITILFSIKAKVITKYMINKTDYVSQSEQRSNIKMINTLRKHNVLGCFICLTLLLSFIGILIFPKYATLAFITDLTLNSFMVILIFPSNKCVYKCLCWYVYYIFYIFLLSPYIVSKPETIYI